MAPEERAAAEEAYRRALAAVVAEETGEAPDWAPPSPEPTEDAPEPAEEPPAATDDAPDASADAPDPTGEGS